MDAISPISPMFCAIEECKTDEKQGLLARKFNQSSVDFSKSQHKKSTTHNIKQSLFSLSNIIAAFSAPKVRDSTTVTTSMESEKAKQPENPNLTLNIVGIRDIISEEDTTECNEDSDDSANNTATTVDSLVSKLSKTKGNGSFVFPTTATEDTKTDEPDSDESSVAASPLFAMDDSDSDDSDDGIQSVNKKPQDKHTAKKDEKKQTGLCLKRIETTLRADSTVKELKEYLSLNHVFNLKKNLIFQLFFSNILMEDDYRTLGYYGVSNNAFVLVAILEGKPLSEREYRETRETLKLETMVGDAPAEFQSANGSGFLNAHPIVQQNNNRNALLEAFTRRHAQNVRQGITAPPQRPAAKKKEENKSVNMKEAMDNFPMERMSCIDFLTFEKDDSCIKMPCGHGMSEESLLGYVLSEVNRRDTLEITCPHLVHDKITKKEGLCRAVWHYPIIKKILTQWFDSQAENENENLLNFMKLELLMARNVLQETFDSQQCGYCHSVLFRKQRNLGCQLSDFQATCPLCTIKHREALYAENQKEILKLEAKIKELKNPKLLKRLKRVKRRLRVKHLKRGLSKVKEEVSISKMRCHLKSKWSNFFIESIDSVESNEVNFAENAKLARKRYRRRKKSRFLDAHTVPKSFLSAFLSESDSSDDEEEKANKVKARVGRRLQRNSKRIANPYLSARIDSGSDESTEYEFVTDESKQNSDNENGNSLRAESESNSAPCPHLFGSESGSDSDSEGDSISSESSYNSDGAFVAPTATNYDFTEENAIVPSEDEDRNFNPVIEANRRSLFRTESDSDSEDDEDEKHEVPAAKPKTPKKKSKEEIRIERMEYKLDRLKMRTFDNTKYNVVLCWGCGIAWKDVSSPACGNHDCSTSFRAQILSILSECDTKKIGSQTGVPSVRACPKCGQLINHWSACKHIDCRQCHTKFCFVCLKKYLKDNGGWQCGPYASKCPDGVKARQGVGDLPSMNVATVTLFEF